ncbi:MAG TPA: hypothetical protein VE225_00930, partial [Rubrobacteraceae bacterium]|nr:hypothetical protein [Rubrobacteraceae bacterium]
MTGSFIVNVGSLIIGVVALVIAVVALRRVQQSVMAVKMYSERLAEKGERLEVFMRQEHESVRE